MEDKDAWFCKIGEVSGTFPSGADKPMRQAVEQAYRKLTGKEPTFVFSGWGAELTEAERAVVENREPLPPMGEVVAPYTFPYQRTFNAIAAAINARVSGVMPVGISVQAFQDEWDKQAIIGEIPPAPAGDYIQQVPEHCDRIAWRGRVYGLGYLTMKQPSKSEEIDFVLKKLVERLEETSSDMPDKRYRHGVTRCIAIANDVRRSYVLPQTMDREWLPMGTAPVGEVCLFKFTNGECFTGSMVVATGSTLAVPAFVFEGNWDGAKREPQWEMPTHYMLIDK